MVPGAKLEVGEVQLELTSYAGPCNNLRPYFSDGEFVRVSQKVNPGWSRLYARVLREGTVSMGDEVRIT
jgi:MOSC domain-containing protein YiiM